MDSKYLLWYSIVCSITRFNILPVSSVLYLICHSLKVVNTVFFKYIKLHLIGSWTNTGFIAKLYYTVVVLFTLFFCTAYRNLITLNDIPHGFWIAKFGQYRLGNAPVTASCPFYKGYRYYKFGCILGPTSHSICYGNYPFE